MSIITVPFSWLLMFLYNLVNNYGLAIILFALVVKLILLPFGMKSKKSTMRMSLIAPKQKELEKKYGNDKVKYQEELMKLYKEENIKPLGGCLWSLIPLPILFALYSVVRQPFTKMMGLTVDQWTYLKTNILEAMGLTAPTNLTYEQIYYAQSMHGRFTEVSQRISENAETIANTVGSFKLTDIDFSFLGLNLGDTPNFKFFLDVTDWSPAAVWPALGLFLIPLVSAGVSILATKLGQKGMGTTSEQSGMKGFTIFMPIMSLWIGFIMPAALGVYWIASSLFGILQDIWLNRKYGRELAAERAAREEKNKRIEKEREKKKLETERSGNVINPNTSRRKMQKIEKQTQEKRSAEWLAVQGKKKKTEKENPSQVGDRPYARGRNYKPDRFQKGYNPDEQDQNTGEGSEGTEDEVLEQKSLPINEDYTGQSDAEDSGEASEGAFGNEITDTEITDGITDKTDE